MYYSKTKELSCTSLAPTIFLGSEGCNQISDPRAVNVGAYWRCDEPLWVQNVAMTLEGESDVVNRLG